MITKYEYLIVPIEDEETDLNVLGQQGWELCFGLFEDGQLTKGYFKRSVVEKWYNKEMLPNV